MGKVTGAIYIIGGFFVCSIVIAFGIFFLSTKTIGGFEFTIVGSVMLIVYTITLICIYKYRNKEYERIDNDEF